MLRLVTAGKAQVELIILMMALIHGSEPALQCEDPETKAATMKSYHQIYCDMQQQQQKKRPTALSACKGIY